MNLNTNTSTAWPAANRAMFVPFVVATPFTLARLFVANGAAVSGNIDVGVFTSGGARVVSAGSTAQAGTSVLQFFDVTDTALGEGSYYFGVSADNTTATISATATASVAVVSGLGVLSQSAAFALPSSATFAAAQDVFVPLVGLTGRTV